MPQPHNLGLDAQDLDAPILHQQESRHSVSNETAITEKTQGEQGRARMLNQLLMRCRHRSLLGLVLGGAITLAGCSGKTQDQAATKQGSSPASPVKVEPTNTPAPATTDVAAKPIEGLADLEAVPGIVVNKDANGNPVAIDASQAGLKWLTYFQVIPQLKKLTRLDVAGPDFGDAQLEQLLNCLELKSLQMQQCAVTDKGIASLATHSKLEDINLDRCYVTDACLKTLGAMPSIKRIRLPRTKISSEGMQFLQNATQLELLDLSDCAQVTDAGLPALAKLTKMRNLSLWGSQITDVGLANLAGMKNLVALSLQDCAVTDAGFEHLRGLTQLRELDVFRTQVGDGCLRCIQASTKLQKLKLRDSSVTDAAFREIATFAELTHLDISETGISDESMEAIGKLPKLVDLNLWKCKVSDDGLKFLVNHPSLKRLNLDDLRGVNDAGMKHVGTIPGLVFLHLGKTNITDDGLKDLVGLQQLKELILDNTVVSKKGVTALKQAIPGLSRVNY